MRLAPTLVLLLGLLPAAVSAAESAEERAAHLAPAFEEIVFGSAGPRPRGIVLRIVGPVAIVPSGPLSSEGRALLERHTRDLTQLTGYAVRVAAGPDDLRDGEAPFWLYLADPPEMARELNRSWISRGLRNYLPRTLCSFVTRGDHRIKEAVLLINRDLDPVTQGHCLIEETVQALGAIDDTQRLNPSAYNDLGGLIDRLQPDDRVILRALFDARVEAGDSREEVAALLPVLLRDAIAQEEASAKE